MRGQMTYCETDQLLAAIGRLQEGQIATHVCVQRCLTCQSLSKCARCATRHSGYWTGLSA